MKIYLTLALAVVTAEMAFGGLTKMHDVVNADNCYDELASCSALIANGGMDCSKSGAQDFCRKSCDSCSSVKRKRSFTVVDSDDCYDELATCSTLIGNGSMDCSKSGAQDFCRKSCNTCSTDRKKRSDDVTVVDSDDCYDELASCSALIDNGGMDCSKSGAQEFCKKSCKTC